MADTRDTRTPPGGTTPPADGLPVAPKASQEFREFLVRTAELLRLDPRKPVAPAPGESPGKPKGPSFISRIPPKVRLAIVGAVAGVLVLSYFAGNSGPPVLPDSIHGVWRTDAAGYSKRRFEMTESDVAFQTDASPTAIERHAITKIKTSTVVEGTLYQVDYLDKPEDKAPLTFEFIVTVGDNPTIIFPNQRRIVWKKSGNATSG